MLSVLLVEEGKLLIKKSSFEELNLVFFTTDLLSVLKRNQGSEVFAEFSGTFCTLWPRHHVVEREFMYFQMFHRRFINFSLGR